MESTNTGDSLVFDARAIIPLCIFKAGEDDLRFYMSGIYVTKHPIKGIYLTTTDGHRLAVWYDEFGETSRDMIITVTDEMVKACKSTKYRTDLHIQLVGNRLVLKQWNNTSGDGADPSKELFAQVEGYEINARYPNIWSVIPDEDKLTPGMNAMVQPKYLRQLGSVGDFLSHGFIGGAYHYTEDGAKVVTRYTDVSNFFVVTMGMASTDDISKPYPDSFVRPTNVDEG